MGRRHFSFLKPFGADRARPQADTVAADSVRDGDPGAWDDGPTGLSGKLAGELFARLLLELPGHRLDLQAAWRDGDRERLARATHKLLGAVVYCDLPELADALRDLKRMTVSGDAADTGAALHQVLRLVDELLACSGYRGT